MEQKDISGIIKKLSKEIEIQKVRATKKGLAFSSPTIEQIEKKLRSSHTPFIISMSWSPNGSAIGSFFYYIYLYNPDPSYYSDIFAYFFFGPANMIANSDTALLSIDERLYRAFAEFPLVNSGATVSVEFNYKFPDGIPVGLYMGNAFIFKREDYDVSTFIDRGCIDVTIY